MKLGDTLYAVRFPNAPENKRWYNDHASGLASSPKLYRTKLGAKSRIDGIRDHCEVMLTPNPNGRPRNPSINWTEIENIAEWVNVAEIVTVELTPTDTESV